MIQIICDAKQRVLVSPNNGNRINGSKQALRSKTIGATSAELGPSSKLNLCGNIHRFDPGAHTLLTGGHLYLLDTLTCQNRVIYKRARFAFHSFNNVSLEYLHGISLNLGVVGLLSLGTMQNEFVPCYVYHRVAITHTINFYYVYRHSLAALPP